MESAHTLQDLRRRDGLTQSEAAALLGFADYNGVGRIESGLRRPNPQAYRLMLLWQRQGLDALRAVQP